jgi:hypothetical protein
MWDEASEGGGRGGTATCGVRNLGLEENVKFIWRLEVFQLDMLRR